MPGRNVDTALPPIETLTASLACFGRSDVEGRRFFDQIFFGSNADGQPLVIVTAENIIKRSDITGKDGLIVEASASINRSGSSDTSGSRNVGRASFVVFDMTYPPTSEQEPRYQELINAAGAQAIRGLEIINENL